MPAVREIIVYLPAGGHEAIAGIACGSAIVGQPRIGSDEVTIYFEVRSSGSRACARLPTGRGMRPGG